MNNTWILVVAYGASALTKKVNEKRKEGFEPIPPHTMAVVDQEAGLHEYAISMVQAESKVNTGPL